MDSHLKLVKADAVSKAVGVLLDKLPRSISGLLSLSCCTRAAAYLTFACVRSAATSAPTLFPGSGEVRARSLSPLAADRTTLGGLYIHVPPCAICAVFPFGGFGNVFWLGRMYTQQPAAIYQTLANFCMIKQSICANKFHLAC